MHELTQSFLTVFKCVLEAKTYKNKNKVETSTGVIEKRDSVCPIKKTPINPNAKRTPKLPPLKSLFRRVMINATNNKSPIIPLSTII